MASADFYVFTGEDGEWLGSLSVDGSPAEMDDEELFGPVDPPAKFTEETFRTLVKKVLDRAVADDFGYSAAQGDEWPWPYPDSSGTDWTYALIADADMGPTIMVSRGVERDGKRLQLLSATHYPNGYALNI